MIGLIEALYGFYDHFLLIFTIFWQNINSFFSESNLFLFIIKWLLKKWPGTARAQQRSKTWSARLAAAFASRHQETLNHSAANESGRREDPMGIFTRFRDIVSSNLNAMLDRAEDPEKLVRLMIREMEDTLVELKSACAGVMAAAKKVQRQRDEAAGRSTFWSEKAELAVSKRRDDLAREALIEKRRYRQRADALEQEFDSHRLLSDQYQEDIRQLEDKLKSAREKQRLLVQRHIHAERKLRAQEEIRRVDSAEAILKFDELENRIERMETEADLVNFGRTHDLEDQLNRLSVDEDIERELEALKTSHASAGPSA
jgi:phage shock protein A